MATRSTLNYPLGVGEGDHRDRRQHPSIVWVLATLVAKIKPGAGSCIILQQAIHSTCE